MRALASTFLLALAAICCCSPPAARSGAANIAPTRATPGSIPVPAARQRRRGCSTGRSSGSTRSAAARANCRAGITSANVAHLSRVRVTLPGTVDSSPIYLHGASIGGATHDAIVVTTHVRPHARARRGQRAHPVDVHARRLQQLGGELSGSRPRAPVADPDRRRVLCRLAERADPQARARGRSRGDRAGRRASRSTPRTRSSLRRSTSTAAT